MSRAAVRLHRLLLLAYPSSFRREFATEMAQSVADRRRHGGRAEWRILLDEVLDAAHAAPRMRWESPMSRVIVLAVAGTAAIVAAIAGQLALVPLAVLGVAGWLAWGRPPRPITPAPSSRRWLVFLVAGGLAIIAAIAIPAVDGGELDSVWWSVMMLALLAGIAMAITGVVLGIDGRNRRVAASHDA